MIGKLAKSIWRRRWAYGMPLFFAVLIFLSYLEEKQLALGLPTGVLPVEKWADIHGATIFGTVQNDGKPQPPYLQDLGSALRAQTEKEIEKYFDSLKPLLKYRFEAKSAVTLKTKLKGESENDIDVPVQVKCTARDGKNTELTLDRFQRLTNKGIPLSSFDDLPFGCVIGQLQGHEDLNERIEKGLLREPRLIGSITVEYGLLRWIQIIALLVAYFSIAMPAWNLVVAKALQEAEKAASTGGST